MFKKTWGIVLALAMLLCLAACGKEIVPVETAEAPSALPAEENTPEPSAAVPTNEPEADEPMETAESIPEPSEAAPSSEPEETEGAISIPSDGGKRLTELIAETNPTNQYEELAAAREICQAQFSLAIASVEQAGLSEDATLNGLFAEWKQQLDDLLSYLKGYEGASEEECMALDEDPEFLYYVDYYLPALRKLYNMTSAIGEDPALWLERYTTVPEASTEKLECDGSWPEGYFFSDRVPALEHIDDFGMSATGSEYGLEDGVDYTLFVNTVEQDQINAYIDQLIGAGVRKEAEIESLGTLLWFGRLNDSEGHISVALMYNSNADGTGDNPALMIQFYNYDIVGIMLDIGTIY